MKTTRYTVWSFDVWGNSEDGYTVNDRSKELEAMAVSHVDDQPTDRELMQALKANGLLKKTCRLSMLAFDGDDLVITVDEAKDSYPLFSLEKVAE